MTSEQWAWTVVSLLGIALYFALTWAFELKWMLGFKSRWSERTEEENKRLREQNHSNLERLIAIGQRINRMERTRDVMPMPNHEDSGVN